MIATLASLLLVQAPVDVNARMSVYSDTDRTTVVSPYVLVEAGAGGGTASAGYTADIITTASVDIRTAASPTVVHDVRNQFSGSYSHPAGDTTLSGSYVYSQENDYLSNGATLGATRDFLEKNVTLGLSFNYQHNLVWRAHDTGHEHPFDAASLSAIYTQVLNPKTISSFNWDLDYGNGFQSSPYRYVFIPAGSDPGPGASYPETEPQERLRNALTGKIARSLATWASLQADYRFYSDTWGLIAHTASARLFLEPGDAWTIRLTARGYLQNDASFYRRVYTTPLTYMAEDRELSALWSLLGGLKVTYNYPSRGTTKVVGLDGKIDLIYFDYLNYRYLANRLATVVEFGVTVKL